MERIKRLGWYQKAVLLFMMAMILVFTVIYPMMTAQKGFAYKDAILIPDQQNGDTIYAGKILGEEARFTVRADKTVEFRYGDKTYGPYTAKEDPSAVPEDIDREGPMTGVELRQGDKIIFRGGMEHHGDVRWLYNEDGSVEEIRISDTTGDNSVTDGNGNAIDTMEPSAYAILDVMAGPELTHKGDWSAWFIGVFLCIVAAIYVLFADEIFRWNLAFQIRNADRAQPSDWEIAWRHVGWTVLPIAALIIFVLGLQ